MPRPAIKTIIDCDVPDNKRRLMSQIGTLSGLYRVDMEPARNVRSNRQNAYYWAAIVSAFAQFLTEQDYDITGPDEAHEFLKARFLAVTVTCRTTGEVIGRRVRSTTELDTAQFSEYCERCRAWLAEFFHIVVPDPGEAVST